MRVLAILVFRDERLVSAHRFDGEAVKIGRDVTCEIQLVDEAVERIHGVLEPTDDGWCVVAVETGGDMLVHAGGAASDEGWLAVGDMIQVGPYLLQVATEDEAIAGKRELEERAAREVEAALEEERRQRPRCPACGSRDPRVAVELHAAIKPRELALDHPEAFSELRGEVCRACGHLSLFVDPKAIVPME